MTETITKSSKIVADMWDRRVPAHVFMQDECVAHADPTVFTAEDRARFIPEEKEELTAAVKDALTWVADAGISCADADLPWLVDVVAVRQSRGLDLTISNVLPRINAAKSAHEKYAPITTYTFEREGSTRWRVSNAQWDESVAVHTVNYFGTYGWMTHNDEFFTSSAEWAAQVATENIELCRSEMYRVLHDAYVA